MKTGSYVVFIGGVPGDMKTVRLVVRPYTLILYDYGLIVLDRRECYYLE